MRRAQATSASAHSSAAAGDADRAPNALPLALALADGAGTEVALATTLSPAPAIDAACAAGTAGRRCEHADATTCSGHGAARADGSCVCAPGFGGAD